MEIIVKAKTEKYGNFTILFDNCEGLYNFLSEIKKNLQFAEMQNCINNDCKPSIFHILSTHYASLYQALKDIVFNCDLDDGCYFSDYAAKNTFILEHKLN